MKARSIHLRGLKKPLKAVKIQIVGPSFYPNVGPKCCRGKKAKKIHIILKQTVTTVLIADYRGWELQRKI